MDICQCYFLDGLSIGPGYFGYTDPLTGTWRPKEFVAEGTTVNDGTNWSAGLLELLMVLVLLPKCLMEIYPVVVGQIQVVIRYLSQMVGLPLQTTLSCMVDLDQTGMSLLMGLKPQLTHLVEVHPHGQMVGVYNGYVDLGPGTLTSIGTEGSGIAQDGVYAIEIDGVIMRDSTTQNLQFGTNGFYFPMDGNSPIGEDKSPSPNDGTVWSSYFTGSHILVTVWLDLQGSLAFDGNLSTAAIGMKMQQVGWTAPGGLGADAIYYHGSMVMMIIVQMIILKLMELTMVV